MDGWMDAFPNAYMFFSERLRTRGAFFANRLVCTCGCYLAVELHKRNSRYMRLQSD